MFARLLFESLRRGRRRKLLAATAIALGTCGATSLAAVLLAAGDHVAAELGAYGANLEVVPSPGAASFPVAGLAEFRRSFWRHNIAAAAPLYPLRARFGPGGPVAPLVGTWFDHPLDGEWRSGLPAVRPTLRVEGRWPREGRAEMALGRRLAAGLGARLGEVVSASLGEGELRLEVVGLVTSGGAEDDEAFTPLSQVQALAGRPGRAVRAEIFALTTPETEASRQDPREMTPEEYEAWYCTAYPSSVAHHLTGVLPGAEVRVVPAVSGPTAEILGRLRQVLGALALLALGGAGLGVTAALTATVLERHREVGLLSALGAEGWKIAAFFLWEAAILGAVGGFAGGSLGLAGGRLLGSWLFALPVSWMPVLLPAAVAGGLAVALAGSAAPVVRALRGRPAAALGGAA